MRITHQGERWAPLARRLDDGLEGVDDGEVLPLARGLRTLW